MSSNADRKNFLDVFQYFNEFLKMVKKEHGTSCVKTKTYGTTEKGNVKLTFIVEDDDGGEAVYAGLRLTSKKGGHYDVAGRRPMTGNEIRAWTGDYTDPDDVYDD